MRKMLDVCYAMKTNKANEINEIWGSHGRDYEYYCVVGPRM
jgi:hypothetical protein